MEKRSLTLAEGYELTERLRDFTAVSQSSPPTPTNALPHIGHHRNHLRFECPRMYVCTNELAHPAIVSNVN
jgi:hypothetical protein